MGGFRHCRDASVVLRCVFERGIDRLFGQTLKATLDAPIVVTPSTEASPEILATAQAALDGLLARLYTSLPAHTVVV